MLSVTRRTTEATIVVMPDLREITIWVKPKPGRPGQTELAIDAPPDVKIFRRELLDKIRAGAAAVQP